METFIERFKKREVLNQIVEVALGEHIFYVQRFSVAEEDAADRRACALLREEGIEPEQASVEKRVAARCEALAEFIKRHVKGWKLSGQDIEFHKQNLDALFESMTSMEKILLGLNYKTACLVDKKKESENQIGTG